MATNGGSGSGRVVYAENKMERRPMKFENPFTLKVGQVFTGFGVGCGGGIGVGRPIHLGMLCANYSNLNPVYSNKHASNLLILFKYLN